MFSSVTSDNQSWLTSTAMMPKAAVASAAISAPTMTRNRRFLSRPIAVTGVGMLTSAIIGHPRR
jgi:hypothetical protein